jgi:hypothetical protein
MYLLKCADTGADLYDFLIGFLFVKTDKGPSLYLLSGGQILFNQKKQHLHKLENTEVGRSQNIDYTFYLSLSPIGTFFYKYVLCYLKN